MTIKITLFYLDEKFSVLWNKVLGIHFGLDHTSWREENEI